MLVLSREQDQSVFVGEVEFTLKSFDVLERSVTLQVVGPADESHWYQAYGSAARRLPLAGAEIYLDLDRPEMCFDNDSWVITFLDFRGCRKVRLGFEFPKDIPVHRAEVYQKVKARSEHPRLQF